MTQNKASGSQNQQSSPQSEGQAATKRAGGARQKKKHL